MILSKQQTFSDAQVATSSAASTNIFDLGATGTVLGGPAALVRDIGKGEPVPIDVYVTAASGTSPTLTVAIQVDDNSSFSSATTLHTSPQVTTTGRVRLFYIPETANERYIRLYYTIGGTSPSFTIDAMVVAADQTND